MASLLGGLRPLFSRVWSLAARVPLLCRTYVILDRRGSWEFRCRAENNFSTLIPPSILWGCVLLFVFFVLYVMCGHAGSMVATWPYHNKRLPVEPQRSFNGVE